VRVVLDTNVWLDLLVFRDAGVALLERVGFDIYADERCVEEFARVLGYPFAQKLLDAERRAHVMAEFRRRATLVEAAAAKSLPRCADRDDQKFLEVALAARALYLVTKDDALLALDRRRLPFRIVTPAGFAKACNSAL
jgi:putative PIN family toxin of toxin-antitoxin system